MFSVSPDLGVKKKPREGKGKVPVLRLFYYLKLHESMPKSPHE